nr:MAG TPA: hypothetical protein [Caudoviricetes sp.]
MNIIDKKYEGLYIIMQLTFAKDGTYGHHGLSDGDIISITPKIVKKVYCIDQSEFDVMMIDIINLNSRENKEDNDVWLMYYFIKDSEYSSSSNGIFDAIKDGIFYNRTMQELFMLKFYNSIEYRSALIQNNILVDIEDKLNMDETVHLRFRTEPDNLIERIKGYRKVDIKDIDGISNSLSIIEKTIFKIKDCIFNLELAYLKQDDSDNLENAVDKICKDHDELKSLIINIQSKLDKEGYYINKETGELENDYRK